MEFETWMLIGIPLFFAMGWITARVDIRQLLSESRTLPRAYFKGLNLLLNEQSRGHPKVTAPWLVNAGVGGCRGA